MILCVSVMKNLLFWSLKTWKCEISHTGDIRHPVIQESDIMLNNNEKHAIVAKTATSQRVSSIWI